jgi:hypothetical protein
MALIHTIQVVDEKRNHSTVSSTRKSETRRYLACIVATTTEASLKIDAGKKAAVEAELVTAKARLAELTAKFGMTPEEAEAKHEVESDRWYNREDGIFETGQRIRLAKSGSTYGHVHNLDSIVKADLLARGFVDPYDKSGTYGICDVYSTVRRCEATLKGWFKLTLGSEGVISWHGTTDLAQKAMGSLDYIRERGDTLAIRTDITITETKKRAKKNEAAE